MEEDDKTIKHIQGQPIQIKVSRGPGGRYDYEVSLYGSDPQEMIYGINAIVDKLNLQYPYLEKEKSK